MKNLRQGDIWASRVDMACDMKNALSSITYLSLNIRTQDMLNCAYKVRNATSHISWGVIT